MKEFERSNEIAKHIYKAIKGKTEEDIKVLNVTDITTLADIFLIVTAQNTRAVAAIADEIEDKLKEEDYQLIGKEGYHTARWVLLDYNGVIVHIFHKEEAEFYNLDKLWNDGEIMDLSI